MSIRKNGKKEERGQILILCAFSLIVLLLFIGLAVDFGLTYMTKASLGKAVDAAALMGAKNLYQGHAQAEALATSCFAMNYHSWGTDVAAPVPTFSYSTDPTTLFTLMKVQASTTKRTHFIGLLPAFTTLNVSASAQASRANVIMSLVLDRSGSMKKNGGAAYLPQSVVGFVNRFDDALDSVAMVSFASNVTPDVQMQPGTATGGFKTPIATAASALQFAGHTFSDGGLKQAQSQVHNKVVSGSAIRVVVFFTDGWANVIQDTLTCGAGSLANPKAVLWNYGGESFQDGGVGVDFMDPTSGAEKCTYSKATGTNTCCSHPDTFPAASNQGMQTQITQANVDNEALYRAIATTDAMRTDPAGPMYVYAIGLGINSSDPSVADPFYRLANDPRSSTFDQTKPIGEANFAKSATDLPGIFDKIASEVILRLTQ